MINPQLSNLGDRAKNMVKYRKYFLNSEVKHHAPTAKWVRSEIRKLGLDPDKYLPLKKKNVPKTKEMDQ